MTDVVPAQAEPTEAQVAFAIERRVKEAMRDGRDALWRLAEALYEFNEAHGWHALGYGSLREWLADPEVNITAGSFNRYVKTWRKLVVERQIDAERLRQLDQSKVAIVTEAICRNEVTADEALSDADTLGARDLREKYYGKEDDSNVGHENVANTQEEDSGQVLPDTPEPVRADELDTPAAEAPEVDLATEVAELLEEAALEDTEAVALTTATVNGETVVAEIVDAPAEIVQAPAYEFPPWVTTGSVANLVKDLQFGIASGATYPRLSRQDCQVAEQLARAWLATAQS